MAARFDWSLKAFRLFVAVLFFGNAVCAGLCATLCNAHICCRLMEGEPPKCATACATKVPACCPMCKQAPKSGGLREASAGPPNCCSWIGKKVTPPAALIAFLSLHHHAPAILHSVFIPAPAPVVGPAFQAVEGDDRAPPERWIDRPSPRAPPVA